MIVHVGGMWKRVSLSSNVSIGARAAMVIAVGAATAAARRSATTPARRAFRNVARFAVDARLRTAANVTVVRVMDAFRETLPRPATARAELLRSSAVAIAAKHVGLVRGRRVLAGTVTAMAATALGLPKAFLPRANAVSARTPPLNAANSVYDERDAGEVTVESRPSPGESLRSL